MKIASLMLFGTQRKREREPTHKFTWAIISKAPENSRKRRVLEAYFIKTICPTLNEQLDNDILTLFRNCIT